MFTGLIEEIGTVVQAGAEGGSHLLCVAAPGVLEDLKPGDSIAVDGACLSVIALGAGSFTVGLSPETLRRTALGELRAAAGTCCSNSALGELRQGARVQLERSLLPGTRLGGHYLQGHVDGTATILEARAEGDALWMKFRAPREFMPYLAPKGYVAIDGASLDSAKGPAQG